MTESGASTRSLCSTCLASIPAQVVERNGRVLLDKVCSAHGRQVELLEEDADWYRRRLDFDQPGTDSLRQTEVRDGCPFDCGLCPEHEQHTCIGLVEVTGACDLVCPTCYASAGSRGPVPRLDVARAVDAFITAEGGEAEILQVSGGEPTTHPEIVEILGDTRRRPLRYVMLNTNGLRIAADERFADQLAGLGGHFEVYLQLDSLHGESMRTLRGADLLERKLLAVSRLAEREIPVTLVATVAAGVNDGELGQLFRFGLETPGVRGLNLQPLAYFGRCDGAPGVDRVTLSGVLRRLESQTGGQLLVSDFVPLPCDVERVAITYLVRRDGLFVPVTRTAPIRQLLPLIDNTLAFDTRDVVSQPIRGLLAGVDVCACFSFVRTFLPLAPPRLLLSSQRTQARHVTEQTFRVTVTSFCDRFNFELRAARRECVHVITPEGLRIPFSAYNTLHRERGRSALA